MVYFIYLHENHKNQPNVGKYDSPMDPLEIPNSKVLPSFTYEHHSFAREHGRILFFFSLMPGRMGIRAMQTWQTSLVPKKCGKNRSGLSGYGPW